MNPVNSVCASSAGDDAVDQPKVKEPLRICFPFSGDTVGGSHISVRGLLRQLDPAHYQSLVVCEVPGGRISELFEGQTIVEDPGSCVALVPGEAVSLQKFWRTLRGLWPRIRLLRQHGIDIVHVNDGRTSANWAIAARLAGARLVWHHRSDPRSVGLRLLAPLVADRVLAVSSFALPPPGLWSARKKAAVLHSPFDTSLRVDRAQARGTLLDELGLPADTLVLGFFGAFSQRKRPLLFVDVVDRLQSNPGRPAVGVMFGEAVDPSMDEALRNRIAMMKDPSAVRIMGYRAPGATWIAACDQLIVPAAREPFGRTLIEAMLVGTAVVATRSGGNIEALEGGLGILVEPENAAALAEASRQLSLDPEATEAMVRRGYAATRARFSEQAHCAAVSQVYDWLCSR